MMETREEATIRKKIEFIPDKKVPAKFYLMLDGEEIAVAERGFKRDWREDFWQVHINNQEYYSIIASYLHKKQKIERFYFY